MERGALAIHTVILALAPGVDPDAAWDTSLLLAGKAQDIHMLRLAWATPGK